MKLVHHPKQSHHCEKANIESPFLVQFGCRWCGMFGTCGQDGQKAVKFNDRMDEIDEIFAMEFCLLNR